MRGARASKSNVRFSRSKESAKRSVRPMDTGATLDDLREAVETLEETDRTARRVLGGAHPTTTAIEGSMQAARAIRARETPPTDAREGGDLDEVVDP